MRNTTNDMYYTLIPVDKKHDRYECITHVSADSKESQNMFGPLGVEILLTNHNFLMFSLSLKGDAL